MIIYIPTLPTKVKLSNKRRPVYYTSIAGLPKKYRNKERYYWDDGKLHDYRDMKPVLKNKALVDKPRFKTINGNILYAGTHYSVRKTLVDSLKFYFVQLIKDVDVEHLPPYPWRISYTFYSDSPKQDIDNRSYIYAKIFQDSLTFTGLIPDDKAEFISALDVKLRPALFSENEHSLLIKINHDKKH